VALVSQARRADDTPVFALAPRLWVSTRTNAALPRVAGPRLAYHVGMTALGVSLLVIGAIVIAVEAHVPTLGMLGGPGVVAVGIGAVLTVSGLGGSVALGIVTALALVAVGLAVVSVSVRKGIAVRNRRVRAGPEGLIGHIGVIRSWDNSSGKVLVDGALWRARQSWGSEDDALPQLHPGDEVVVERLSGLTLAVRRAEEWELAP
jgi:membrane-bound ClpP family serine protease